MMQRSAMIIRRRRMPIALTFITQRYSLALALHRAAV